MLVITRKMGESFYLDDNLITVLGIKGDRVYFTREGDDVFHFDVDLTWILSEADSWYQTETTRMYVLKVDRNTVKLGFKGTGRVLRKELV